MNDPEAISRNDTNDAESNRRRPSESLRYDLNDAIIRSTVRLREVDRQHLLEIKKLHKIQTDNKAIRLALKIANEGADAELVRLAHRILQWADGLQFANERERRELRSLSAELYHRLNTLDVR